LILELSVHEEIELYGLQGEGLMELIPDSEWEVIQNSNVNTFYESPGIIAEHLYDFIAFNS
jgi:hypothetical protein